MRDPIIAFNMGRPMTTFSDSFLLEKGTVASIVGAGGKTTLMFSLAQELSGRGHRVLTTTTTRIYPPDEGQSPCCVLEPEPAALVHRAKELFEEGLHHFTAASYKDPREGKLVGFAPHIVDELCERGCFNWILVEADGAARRPLKAPAPHEPVIPSSSTVVIAMAGMEAVGRPLDTQWVFRPDRFSKITGLPLGATVEEPHVCKAFLHPDGLFKGTPEGAVRIAYLNKTDIPGCLSRARNIARLIMEKKGGCPRRVVMGSLLHGCCSLEWVDKIEDTWRCI